MRRDACLDRRTSPCPAHSPFPLVPADAQRLESDVKGMPPLVVSDRRPLIQRREAGLKLHDESIHEDDTLQESPTTLPHVELCVLRFKSEIVESRVLAPRLRHRLAWHSAACQDGPAPRIHPYSTSSMLDQWACHDRVWQILCCRQRTLFRMRAPNHR